MPANAPSLTHANRHQPGGPDDIGWGKPAGLTGAVAATRYAGATASGAPVTGAFLVGDFVIDQTGKVWICSVAGSPGTWVAVGAFSRFTATKTSSSLANLANQQTTVAIALGYRVYAIQTDRAARVRLYSDTTRQAADLTRAIGTDPGANSGVMLDYVTATSPTNIGVAAPAVLSPLVDGMDYDGSPTTSIPITITNLSGSTSTVLVTLTVLRTE